MKKFYLIALFILCIISEKLSAQQPVLPKPVAAATDTSKIVDVLQGTQRMRLLKIDSVTDVQVLAGTVKLRQGTTLFYCDSCILNEKGGFFEAFGRVHINDSDTANIYSDYLKYIIDKQYAYLKNNVKLTDGKGNLTTNELEYDISAKLATYKNSGKVLTKKSILTSTEAFYFTDLKDVYFKKNVELKDPAYYLKADTLLYNTETETVRFVTDTYIRDSSGRIIRTKEGFYNLKTGEAEFGKNPVIIDGSTIATATTVFIKDSTGQILLKDNAVIRDTAEGRTIIGGEIIIDKKTEAFLATRKPVMIIKQDNDSIYISADTLFSARLSDLYAKKDTVPVKKTKTKQKGIKVVDVKKQEPKDSANRYFEGFRNVKIFHDSLQAVCDSMFYSFKDSIFQLYQQPVVWSNGSQITGDTILLFTKNKKADRLKVFENSFMVNRAQEEVYNQVKSTRMDGFFSDGALDSVRARGSAETIYYLQDEDSAFTGINQNTCDVLDIYFAEKELKKVVFRSQVKGTLWPIKQKTLQEMRLQNFKWLEARRPKTKFELFE
jgi:lipopolysaccharide export system protein LptA